MIDGSCHCGNVRISISEEPQWLTSCNCSICRRIGALWGHVGSRSVTISADSDATSAYIRGDRTLAFHTCRNCGCTTHWTSLGSDDNARMAVNFRMCSEEDVGRFAIRHFDGADTGAFED